MKYKDITAAKDKRISVQTCEKRTGGGRAHLDRKKEMENKPATHCRNRAINTLN